MNIFFRCMLLMIFSMVIGSFAQAAKLHISCSGDASAALSSNSYDILNPYYEPFSIDLEPDQSLFIGNQYGGCGQFGCPTRLNGIHRVFMDSNGKIYRQKVNNLDDIMEIFPGTNIFHIGLYSYAPRSLECSLHIKH